MTSWRRPGGGSGSSPSTRYGSRSWSAPAGYRSSRGRRRLLLELDDGLTSHDPADSSYQRLSRGPLRHETPRAARHRPPDEITAREPGEDQDARVGQALHDLVQDRQGIYAAGQVDVEQYDRRLQLLGDFDRVRKVVHALQAGESRFKVESPLEGVDQQDIVIYAHDAERHGLHGRGNPSRML